MDVASTSVELALDALATVMESKIRYSGHETLHTWQCLQSCLRSGCRSVLGAAGSDEVETRLLRRCVSLLLQRLARSNDAFAPRLVAGIAHLLSFVEERRLCGNLLTTAATASSVPAAASSAEGGGPRPSRSAVQGAAATFWDLNHAAQSPEEYQTMCYLTDLLATLRKATERPAAAGAAAGAAAAAAAAEERRALRVGLQAILGCMWCTSDHGADRIADEVYAHVVHMTDPSRALSADAYKVRS